MHFQHEMQAYPIGQIGRILRTRLGNWLMREQAKIPAGIGGGYGVQHHPAKPLLGFYEAVFPRRSALTVQNPGNGLSLSELFGVVFQSYLA